MARTPIDPSLIQSPGATERDRPLLERESSRWSEALVPIARDVLERDAAAEVARPWIESGAEVLRSLLRNTGQMDQGTLRTAERDLATALLQKLPPPDEREVQAFADDIAGALVRAWFQHIADALASRSECVLTAGFADVNAVDTVLDAVAPFGVERAELERVVRNATDSMARDGDVPLPLGLVASRDRTGALVVRASGAEGTLSESVAVSGTRRRDGDETASAPESRATRRR